MPILLLIHFISVLSLQFGIMYARKYVVFMMQLLLTDEMRRVTALYVVE